VAAYANGGRAAEVGRGRGASRQTPALQRQVKTILVQQDKSGKLTPVNITAARLTYADNERLARFEGGVTVHGADGTLTARQVDVYLRPATSTTGAATKPANFSMSAAGPSQLDRIVAVGNVVVQQANRRATGQRLVYTAADEKSVMTGGPPSIFDAEHGTITGSSLTFYTRDDRVLVEGGNGTRTVTTTRVSK
jgi:lipopolysaccharide export system protein LptA